MLRIFFWEDLNFYRFEACFFVYLESHFIRHLLVQWWLTMNVPWINYAQPKPFSSLNIYFIIHSSFIGQHFVLCGTKKMKISEHCSSCLEQYSCKVQCYRTTSLIYWISSHFFYFSFASLLVLYNRNTRIYITP